MESANMMYTNFWSEQEKLFYILEIRNKLQKDKYLATPG